VNEEKMAEAWALVDKAIQLEAKANQPGKSENMQRIAAKAVDKKLDEAVRLEAEALAE
jgi:hypothetical protein